MNTRRIYMITLISLILCLLLVVICILYHNAKIEANASETTIVLDAGHGGNDPGKIGSGNIKEKDINLEIAIKLKSILEEEGFEVVMTRTEDVSLADDSSTNKKLTDLKRRVELTEQSGAECMVSIHQNSYGDSSVKGAQVFYHSASEESELLARRIQESLIENVDIYNQRIQKTADDLYLLRKTSCACVIVECGFLSCPEEAAKLTDDRYQQKIADAIASAIVSIYK